jgi:type IV pilus assembly protein PilE
MMGFAFPKPRYANGLTMIELLIMLAILMILAAIAYPSYQEQVRRGRRAEAKGVLTEMAQFMERYYTQNNSYRSASLPVMQSPRTGQAAYRIDFANACTVGAVELTTSPEADCFLLQAVPVQASSMVNDRCGTFMLDHTSNKTVSGRDGASVCWEK